LVFDNAFAIDTGTNAARVIVLAALLLVVCLSIETVRAHKRETEFYILLALSAAGILVMAGATDLLMLFAGYLLTSVPTYGLAVAVIGCVTSTAMPYLPETAPPSATDVSGRVRDAGRTLSRPECATRCGRFVWSC
jgi:NADH-quinone oxidoreductase subunit N